MTKNDGSHSVVDAKTQIVIKRSANDYDGKKLLKVAVLPWLGAGVLVMVFFVFSLIRSCTSKTVAMSAFFCVIGLLSLFIIIGLVVFFYRLFYRFWVLIMQQEVLLEAINKLDDSELKNDCFAKVITRYLMPEKEIRD